MNTALLTIDDFPSKNTKSIVDFLKEKNIKAIFFATGKNVEKFYEEALYVVKNRMIVGNHSYSHPECSKISLEEAISDIEKCEDILNKLYQDAGVERKFRPFRFPYGDKGGSNKDALQNYLKEKGFDKVYDKHLCYDWWKEFNLDKDIDTFWTFDFEEYRLHLEKDFSKDYIWDKMQNPNPSSGAALFAENNRHILLLHAHDETERFMPEYYKAFINHLLEKGITFDEPEFF